MQVLMHEEEYAHMCAVCERVRVLTAHIDECVGDIWVWARVNVNYFIIVVSAMSCFYHT